MNRTTALKQTIAVIIIALTLTSLVSPALSTELTDKRKQLRNVNSELSKTRQKIKEAKAKESQLVEQIGEVDNQVMSAQTEYDRLETELAKVSSERGQTENQLAALQAELARTLEELATTQAKLVEQKGLMNNRLEHIYKRGKSSYMDFILNSNDFISLLNRIRFLEFIVAQDLDIVRRIQETKRAIEIKKAEVEENKASVNNERMALINQERHIKSLTNAKRAQKQALESEINKKQTLLTQIKNNRAAYELAEDQLLEESSSLATKIRRLEQSLRGRINRSPVQVGASGFVWPTDGPVTSSFGMRKHPILGTVRMHTGIDIGAPYGQSVVSANDGIVIQAEWLRGYGQTVVVAHGNGISTLYGHLSDILVSDGQSVTNGQTVGRIGSTGLSTGPHLHFEVRKDGEPQDPMNWY